MEASNLLKLEEERAGRTHANYLSVANWSPKTDVMGGVKKNAQHSCRASSTDISTESDSEKDVAEAYSGSQREEAGSRKRAASPSQAVKATKAPRLCRRSVDETTAAETEAIAVLEHFRNAAEGKKGVQPLTVSAPAGDGKHRQEQMPSSAIQNLAQLIEQQRSQRELSMSRFHPSPFQGRPSSPVGKSKPTSGIQMRSCLSESSAQGLGALSKQDGKALALLQSISATNQHFKDQAAKHPGLSAGHHAALSSALQAMDKAAAGLPPTFSTYSSSTATDMAFDVNAFLNHSNRLGMAASMAQEKEGAGHENEPSSSRVNQMLGAFGSVIPGANEKSSPPSRPSRPPDTPSSLDKESVGISSRPPKGHTSTKSSGRDGQPLPQLSTKRASDPGQPDPQILEWIVGNRATLTDRSKAAFEGMTQRVSTGSQPESRMFARQESRDGRLAEREGSTTLRRPIAIRPRDMKESAMSIAPTASEGSLEGLLARMHAAAGAQTPTAQVSTAGAAPQLPEFGQGGQSHGTPPHGTPPAAAAANDLGRVMQWAGTELLLRDQKVREIQRLRSEDRQAHDATFSAVAADVSRLKFGQAQLVKAHKQYQEMLLQKEKALEEKDVLIAGLTRALSELKQQLHSSALSPSSKPEMEVEAVKDVQQTVIPEQETTALEVIEKGANPARDVTPIGQQAEENISRPATPVTEAATP